jgi:hemolysin activation/secretion protein
MRQAFASLVALGAIIFLPSATVMAQIVAPPALNTSPLTHIIPQQTPNLGAGLPNFQPLTTEGSLPSVVIPVGNVSIIGATAFPASVMNGKLAGLSGRRVPLAKIESARLALVELYRSHGFVLSTVSMEIDAAGDVRFIVTEGHIVAVELSDNIGPAGAMVLAFLDHLTAERPVSEASLEHWLLLSQQIPGVSVHAVLQSDSDDPGSLTLVAEVARQTVSVLVTADNRGFADTGPAEGLADFKINSVTSFGDQTEISLFHTSGNTDNFGQAAESFFIGSNGLRLKLYGGAGRAYPSRTLREAGYNSDLEVFGGQLTYPLLLRRNQALNLTLHFDALQNFVVTQDLRASSDSTRVGRLATQYAWQDLWAGDQRDAVNVLNLQVSQGILGLGAAPDGRALGLGGRYREKMDFWKFNGSISRTQTLFNPLPQTSVSLRLEGGGQYSNDVLPAAEEFYLGGNRFTRGFYSGQVSGDRALYATTELQLNSGLSFNVFNVPIDFGAQIYTFYDYGETWENLPADLDHRLESAGAGIRLGVTQNLEVDGEFVHRLTPQLDAGNPTSVPLSKDVLYWGVTARY